MLKKSKSKAWNNKLGIKLLKVCSKKTKYKWNQPTDLLIDQALKKYLASGFKDCSIRLKGISIYFDKKDLL